MANNRKPANMPTLLLFTELAVPKKDVAQELDIDYATFWRWMKEEMDDEKRDKVEAAARSAAAKMAAQHEALEPLRAAVQAASRAVADTRVALSKINGVQDLEGLREAQAAHQEAKKAYNKAVSDVSVAKGRLDEAARDAAWEAKWPGARKGFHNAPMYD